MGSKWHKSYNTGTHFRPTLGRNGWGDIDSGIEGNTITQARHSLYKGGLNRKVRLFMYRRDFMKWMTAAVVHLS